MDVENDRLVEAAEDRLAAAAAAVGRALDVASADLVDRRVLVELVALAAIAREHVLVLGPPGTAKSAAVRLISSCLGGSYFEYLLGRFTEPAEIFGPIDLRRLQDGVFETVTAGMLPEAEIAFLDEVFQGSTAILNTLLGILNERKFRRGAVTLDCPLRVVVGASNELPSDPSLAAFADRFLLRHFVSPIAEPRLEDLLEAGWRLADSPTAAVASLEDLDLLAAAARRADLAAVRPLLAEAVRLLRKAGIPLSDRRLVKSQRLIAAAALLDRRLEPDGRDLWPLVFILPDEACQQVGGDALKPLLEDCRSAALSAAAEEASGSVAARRERLRQNALRILGGEAAPAAVEAVLREIDAELPAADRGEELAALRAELAGRLAATAPAPSRFEA